MIIAAASCGSHLSIIAEEVRKALWPSTRFSSSMHDMQPFVLVRLTVTRPDRMTQKREKGKRKGSDKR